MRNLTAICAVLIFLAPNLRAQSKAVCSLLTDSDVSSIGATGPGIPSDMTVPSGPSKGAIMRMCTWRMKTGGLHLGANQMPPGTSRQAVEAELTKSYQLLTSKGWKQDKKDFGSVSCTLFTPPAGDKEAPAYTGCVGVGKGMLVNADTLSMTGVSMEKLKALVNSASGRL